MAELDAGVIGSETPVDGADGGVALGDPGRDLALKGVSVRQPSVEALAGEDVQLDLGHVEPSAGLVGDERGLWAAADTTMADRKRLVRCLLREVVLLRDDQPRARGGVTLIREATQ